MTRAVCIRCGLAKNRPVDRCARCGLQPQSHEEKAKSLILSTAYELDGEYRGKTIEELTAISAAIETGQPLPLRSSRGACRHRVRGPGDGHSGAPADCRRPQVDPAATRDSRRRLLSSVHEQIGERIAWPRHAGRRVNACRWKGEGVVPIPLEGRSCSHPNSRHAPERAPSVARVRRGSARALPEAGPWPSIISGTTYGSPCGSSPGGRGLTLAALFALACGLGGVTTVFTLVDAVILRPLPVASPGELVWLRDPSFSYPVFQEVSARAGMLSQRVRVGLAAAPGAMDQRARVDADPACHRAASTRRSACVPRPGGCSRRPTPGDPPPMRRPWRS